MEVIDMTKQYTKSELMEMDKKHFLHPTSNVKQQQENGPAIIFKNAEGIYAGDVDGTSDSESMRSLWNANIGYGRKELGEVAEEQIENLSLDSRLRGDSNEPAIKLAAKIGEFRPGDLDTTGFTTSGSEA